MLEGMRLQAAFSQTVVGGMNEYFVNAGKEL
jgi:hypothetical protein